MLRGEGDGIPVGDQPWFRRVLDEQTARTQLRLNAQNSREVKERAGPIMEVIRAAAPGDAVIGALWQRIETEFHANQRQVVESPTASAPCERDWAWPQPPTSCGR